MRTFFTLVGLIGLGLLLMSNDNGVATASGKDRTGSPFNATGGAQCGACHAGAAFSTSIDTRLKDSTGAIVTEYYANHTYTFEVEVSSTGATGFGFQSLALLTPSNVNAGTLTASSSNTHIKVLSSTRRYAEHSLPSTSGLFIMNWKAPVFGSGTVKFYSAGNGVNLNALKTGDKGSPATVLTITENTLASVNEIKLNSINVYPNPAIDNLSISINHAGNGKLVIVSLEGKVQLVRPIQFDNTTPLQQNISTLASGTYFVSVVDENGKQLASTKFIKK